jgi:hypothetical protein
MVHRPAAGACGIHAPWKPNGPRPPCSWCRPLASQLGMPPVTLDAERRAAAQHNRSGTSHPRRIGLDLRWSSQRRSTTDPLRFGRLYVSPEPVTVSDPASASTACTSRVDRADQCEGQRDAELAGLRFSGCCARGRGSGPSRRPGGGDGRTRGGSGQRAPGSLTSGCPGMPAGVRGLLAGHVRSVPSADGCAGQA